VQFPNKNGWFGRAPSTQEMEIGLQAEFGPDPPGSEAGCVFLSTEANAC
jgi:hypothetical protein